MGGSAPTPPTPPDPVTTASAQGGANVQTAIAQASLNNINQNTPYGTMQYGISGYTTETMPDGSTQQVPQYTSTQTLSPEQEKLYQEQNALANQSNNAASLGLHSVNQTFQNPVTADNLPSLTTSVSTPTLATGYDPGGAIQTGYASGGQIQSSVPYALQGTNAPSTFGQTQSQIQSDVPVSQAATTFGATQNGVQYFAPQDFTAARDSATNAVLQRLAPTMASQQEAMNANLANQGLVQGSAAWNAAQLSQNQANNDLRLGAVATGDNEQQALFGEQATANQLFNAAQNQDYTQQQGRGLFALNATTANNAANLAAGQFHNAAQQQDFGQLLDRANYAQSAYGMDNAAIGANNTAALNAGQFANAAQAQGEAENAARAAFGNQAQAQQNSQNQQASAFGNSALQSQYGLDQSAATFGNQAREQSLSDQETINNNVVNQISALMHGGQVTTGQYQGYTPAQVGETPISQDTYASANLAEQGYQTQAQIDAQNNAAMFSALGGLFGLGGKMMGISDRRTKRDVVAFGPITGGLPVYAFRYLWEDETTPLTLGHMADEVAAVAPHAVLRHPAGFDMVDYAAI